MSALDRGKLLFASLSPSESWLRQQSSISPDPQKIHSNKIKIHSNGHCLCRGPGASLCQVCPSYSCKGFVPHTVQIPGLGSSPRAPAEMLCCRTQGARPSKHRNVLDEACHALRAVKLLSALQDQPFITCSCLISCSLAANLLKGCFL